MAAGRYSRQARLFKLLSHPTRLEIIDVLRQGDACVCNLQKALNLSQPFISRQLQVLRNAGVVDTQRDGQFIYYRLADTRLEQSLNAFLGPVNKRPSSIGE
ncbi:MAG: winged helix-turn-helix transcriptional regulator [Anaerolineales bacterium]|nr:winged helix-turn-helix transcriptional regulator [Anaerolineales bacterium]